LWFQKFGDFFSKFLAFSKNLGRIFPLETAFFKKQKIQLFLSPSGENSPQKNHWDSERGSFYEFLFVVEVVR